MKHLITYLCFLGIPFVICGQISNYNQFPTKHPTHILDDKLDNISFAYSLRVLESDYEGPLIRLRRASDNAEQDFGWGDDDRIDLVAIDNWRSGSNVFVVTWYVQSGLTINATQADSNLQPQFFPDPLQPYFVGDGVNDNLMVQESIQNVTENGKNGTVLGVFLATDRADSAFGVVNGLDRWLVHINWSNEQCYFDPGYCCNSPRSFVNNLPSNPTNPGSLGVWDQYSFIRRDDPSNTATDRIIMRMGNTEETNGAFPDNRACSLTVNFALCAITTAAGNGASASTTRFAEMIMYKEGKEDAFLDEIENDQINFWNL